VLAPAYAMPPNAWTPAAPRRRLPARSVDLALMALLLIFLVGALVFFAQPGSRSLASFCVHLTAAVHLIVLVLQARRWNPSIFSGRAIGLAGVFYWFLLEALQSGGDYPEFGADHVVYGLVLVQCYTVAFLACYDFFARKPRPEAALLSKAALQPRNSFALTLAVALGWLLGVTPILVYGGQDWGAIFEGILASRSGKIGWGRSNLGDSRSAVLALAYFGWAAAGLGALAALRMRRRWLLRLLAATATTLVVSQLFFAGTRHILAIVAMPVIGVLVLGTSPRRRGRVMVALTLGFIVLYGAFQIQRYARARGFRNVEKERIIQELARPHGHQLFIEVLYVADIVPDEMPYSTPGSTLFFLAINPIPRAVWPEKPIDPFWRDFSNFRTGTDATDGGTTIAASNIGQLYAEGGLAMVLLCGLAFGWWAAIADDLFLRHGRRPETAYVAAMLMTLMLLSYRGINAGLLYVIPAVYLLLTLARALEKFLRLPEDLGSTWPLQGAAGAEFAPTAPQVQPYPAAPWSGVPMSPPQPSWPALAPPPAPRP
jgi:hypothetical protein